jgi:hypothetical protein
MIPAVHAARAADHIGFDPPNRPHANANVPGDLAYAAISARQGAFNLPLDRPVSTLGPSFLPCALALA